MREGWWDVAIDILPNLLGFSFGGTAIFLGLIEPRLVRYLSDDSDGVAHSDLAVIVASFVHFVIVQGLALLAACICKAKYLPVEELPLNWLFATFHISVELWCWLTSVVGWGASSWVFVYALTLVLATSLEVFRVSQMIESMTRHELASSKIPHETQLPATGTMEDEKT